MVGIDDPKDETEWNEQPDHSDAEPLETEQLALSDEEERLPWLEGSDDDNFDDDAGTDWGHTLRLGLLAVVALGALVGGIYWTTHRNSDPVLVADGSLVPADGQPYKEAPKNPGGKTFDGTGDTSFAVSEGKDKPAQIAPSAAATAPASAAKPAAGATAASTGGVGVQVGAFSSKDAAEAGWAKLAGHSGGALAGLSHRVIAGTADNGTVYRLQAIAPNGAAATALCSKLKASGIACQVK